MSCNAKDESALICDLKHLVDELSQRPAPSLLPFRGYIDQLSAAIGDIAFNLDSNEPSGFAATLPIQPKFLDGSESFSFAPLCGLETPLSLPDTPSPCKIEQDQDFRTLSLADRHAEDTLQSVMALLPCHSWLLRDQRISHMQLLLLLKGPKSAPSLEDKTLLICSCLSLAYDFELFEQTNGWRSKREILWDRISHTQDPKEQSTGKHISKFVTSQWKTASDPAKVIEGVRFGIKLQILCDIGEKGGLAPGFCLLLVLDFYRTSRLSFKNLARIMTLIQDRTSDEWSHVTTFCLAVRQAWRRTMENYQMIYSTTSNLLTVNWDAQVFSNFATLQS